MVEDDARQAPAARAAALPARGRKQEEDGLEQAQRNRPG